jgi:hypothetical protein
MNSLPQSSPRRTPAQLPSQPSDLTIRPMGIWWQGQRFEVSTEEALLRVLDQIQKAA